MTGHSGDTITGAQRALRAAGDVDRAPGWVQREKRKQRSPWLRAAGQQGSKVGAAQDGLASRSSGAADKEIPTETYMTPATASLKVQVSGTARADEQHPPVAEPLWGSAQGFSPERAG